MVYWEYIYEPKRFQLGVYNGQKYPGVNGNEKL